MTLKSKLSIIIVIALAVIIAAGGVGAGYYFYQKALALNNKPEIVSTDLADNKGAFASVLFGKDKYELSYNQLPADSIEVLSTFEFGDNWVGKGFWDSRIFAQGQASLALNVSNHDTEAISYTFPEKKDFANVKYINYLANVSDIQVLESHVFKIGDTKMENYYVYTVTNLKPGWNSIHIPIDSMLKINKNADFGLDKIEKVQLETTAQYQHSLVVNFDEMEIFRNNAFLTDWQSIDNKFLSLSKFNEKVVFKATKTDTIGTIQATLANIPGLNDFVYEAKVSPQTTTAEAGLFFRGSYITSKGYYFTTGGAKSNTWTLRKYTDKGWENIINGELNNFSYDTNQFYWLRADVSGDNVKVFFSINGQDFTKLASVSDDTYMSGGVGVALFNGYAYFDDFKVKK